MDYPMDPKSNGSVFIRDRKGDFHDWIRVRGPQAKDIKQCHHPSEAGKGREGFSSRVYTGSAILTHLNFGLLDSSTFKRIHFAVLSHTVCGGLFRQPKETNTL